MSNVLDVGLRFEMPLAGVATEAERLNVFNCV